MKKKETDEKLTYYIPPQNLSAAHFRANSGAISHQRNIYSTSIPCTGQRYPCPNWHVTSVFELYQCFVAGHVPYKIQTNPRSSTITPGQM